VTCLVFFDEPQFGDLLQYSVASSAMTIRMIGSLMETLNPAVARALKRLHYPLDVMPTCVRRLVAYPLRLRHLGEVMAERAILRRPFNSASLGHQGIASSGEGLSPQLWCKQRSTNRLEWRADRVEGPQ
jgi:transposase-like protein